MNNYIVLYRRSDIQSPMDEPFGFQCWAVWRKPTSGELLSNTISEYFD